MMSLSEGGGSQDTRMAELERAMARRPLGAGGGSGSSKARRALAWLEPAEFSATHW